MYSVYKYVHVPMSMCSNGPKHKMCLLLFKLLVNVLYTLRTLDRRERGSVYIHMYSKCLLVFKYGS